MDAFPTPATLHDRFRGALLGTDAVTQAVQLGGDTDTIAAMTGALVGALHGVTAIPTPWRSRLEARDRLEALADDLFTAAARQHADAEAP